MTDNLGVDNDWFEELSSEPFLIAGPCAAESEKQILDTGRFLAETGKVNVFRAGLWKPRTRPGTFEGARLEALPWLKKLKQETGLKLITEVARASHIDAVLEAGIDMIWIGARTTGNPFAVDEIADRLSGVDIPVFVKNPLHPDPELWIGSIERFKDVGIRKLAAIHRGFYPYEPTELRNLTNWDIPVELMRKFPNLPMICDPSHIAGKRELVPEIANKALSLGMNGLMIEVHPDPDSALSDARQQLDFELLKNFLDLK